MEINVGLKNKYEFILTDAKTGRIKQKAEAHNLITDTGFTNLCNILAGKTNKQQYFYTYSSYYYSGWAYQILLGTGAGTPSKADINLFNHKIGQNTSYDSGYVASDNKSGWAKLKAIWQVTEGNGNTYSEVGLSGGGLNTHAMIKDSNGNNITITKTESDVLTVYATIYWSINYVFNDTNFLLVGNSNNKNFLAAMLSYNYGTYDYYGSPGCLYWHYGDSNIAPSYSDTSVKGTEQFSESTYWNDSLHAPLVDTANKKITYRHSIFPAEANGKTIKEVYVSGSLYNSSSVYVNLFRLVFPCVNFTETQIIKDELHQLDIKFELTFSEVT